MEASRIHFGIVGGGLLGMTLSLRLAQRGHRVTLLEAGDQLGGLADSWQLGDLEWDRHYHVTLQSDTYLRGVLQELGLDESMQWSRTQTGFLVDGRLLSMSNVWDFLRFPPLNLIDKARLAWTISYAARVHDWRALEQIPVDEWLIRHSGRRTFERIWLPLLKAKLGDAWQRTSAAFIWATIQRLYAARRSGLKHEMFGYLPGGYGRMLRVFRERLEQLGVQVCTRFPVDAIERGDEVLSLTTPDGRGASFDRVVVTTPAAVTARVCPQLSEEERRRLEGIEYLGIVCASLLMRTPLAGYYVTNITDAAPFTGVIEMTALVNPAELKGHTLVYLPKYVTAVDPAWSQTDDQIRSEFLAALEKMYPGFQREDVLAFRVSRVRHVFALSTLDYSRRVSPIQTSVPGLFVVNSAQIVNGTLNVNETVRLAESAIEGLCHRLPCSATEDEDQHDTDDCELVARPR